VGLKVFSLFKISLENFFKVKFHFAKQLRIQPSEVEEMPYYEYHYMLDFLIKDIKEDNKRTQEQNDNQSGAKMPKMPNMPKIPAMRKY